MMILAVPQREFRRLPISSPRTSLHTDGNNSQPNVCNRIFGDTISSEVETLSMPPMIRWRTLVEAVSVVIDVVENHAKCCA
jgi:hypothetical protein